MKETLRPIQQRAIRLLLEGLSIHGVIEELNIDKKTLWGWKKEALFICEYNKQCNSINNKLKNRHHKLVEKSLNVLEEALELGTDTQKITVAMAIINAYKPIPEVEESYTKIARDLLSADLFGAE
jgi:hypothetical protein